VFFPYFGYVSEKEQKNEENEKYKSDIIGKERGYIICHKAHLHLVLLLHSMRKRQSLTQKSRGCASAFIIIYYR